MAHSQCAYCLCLCADQIDHVDPLARGGLHQYENLVAACRRCNLQKGARTALEFLLGWPAVAQLSLPFSAGATRPSWGVRLGQIPLPF